jgi:putative ABC transport system permease protein
VLLDGEPHAVIGVGPKGFAFPTGAEVWSPLSLSGASALDRRRNHLTAIGRLADGRAYEEFEAEAAAVAARLERAYPDTNRDRIATVRTLRAGFVGEGATVFIGVWQAAALLFLVVACANAANLMVAQMAERRREFAVRLAIGASRWRLVRQLLIESGLLAAAAAVASLGAAALGVRVMRDSMPAEIIRYIPGWDQFAMSGRMLAATGVAAAVVAAIIGLAPALHATRAPASGTLRDGARGATDSRARARVRSALAGAQIALALALLAAAALSIGSVQRTLVGPKGFDPDGVVTATVTLPDVPYADVERRRRFVRDVIDRLRSAPGVDAVAAANAVPFSNYSTAGSIFIEGQPDEGAPPSVGLRSATPELLRALGIPLLAGRGPAPTDVADAPRVAAVSRGLAQRFWPGQDPLGRRFKLTRDGEWITVVGVVGDVMQDWFLQMRPPMVYQPYEQAPRSRVFVVARVAGNPATAAPALRAAIHATDPQLPVTNLQTLRDTVSIKAVGLRYMAGIMSVLGGLALVLSMVGVYSVMAFVTKRRTQEFGVRAALGAAPGDLLRLALRQAARTTLVGVLAGGALAVAVGRVMERSLFGAVALDAASFVQPVLALAAAALVAAYVPARRAAAVDPTIALRAE